MFSLYYLIIYCTAHFNALLLTLYSIIGIIGLLRSFIIIPFTDFYVALITQLVAQSLLKSSLLEYSQRSPSNSSSLCWFYLQSLSTTSRLCLENSCLYLNSQHNPNITPSLKVEWPLKTNYDGHKSQQQSLRHFLAQVWIPIYFQISYNPSLKCKVYRLQYKAHACLK